MFDSSCLVTRVRPVVVPIRRISRWAVAAPLLLAAASFLQPLQAAELVTWELRGNFIETAGDLPPEIAPGAGYRLLLTYDAAAPLVFTRSDGQGGLRYQHDYSSFVYTVYVDGIATPFVLKPETGGSFFLRDNYLSDTGNGTPTVPTDGITFGAQTGDAATDGEDFGVILRGSDTTVFDGDVLPVAPDPRLMQMQLRVFQYTRWEGGRIDPVTGKPKPCASCFVADVDSIRRITGPQLADFTLRSNVVSGCKSVVGTVTLDAPAPPGGRLVKLTDSLAAASLGTELLVPEGATSRNVTIKTVPVSADETGVVGATLDDFTLEDSLTVRPMGISSLAFPTKTVTGGASLNGSVKLECAAGPSSVPVELNSSLPNVAQPFVATVIVSAGQTTAPVLVNTAAVTAQQRPVISATANETMKSQTLTVNPAASVGPASLKFPGTPVGQTSAPLTATLTNKGVAAFAVNTIGITGTSASWFAQINDCGASLAAGASCTISVTFTPAAALSKSAKLSISTSATSTPLSVSLSGTGVL